MGKEFYLNRYSLIIRRLEKSPATYAQLEKCLFESPGYRDNEWLTYSIRTLQRDIKDINRLFNIEIVNDRRGDKRYSIVGRPEMEMDEYNQALLESYQILNAINQYPDFANYVFPENRQPRGLNHFYNLLHAIRSKKIIQFEHFKFGKTDVTIRKVYPLALKESKHRWYLVAVDTKDEKLKTFGLDRMDNLQLFKTSFKRENKLSVPDHFAHSFGVISPGASRVEEVVLQASHNQAEYIKSFPLHASQTVSGQTETVVTFRLSLYITYDFVQELLSYGKNIEIISPLRLRNKMVQLIKETLQLYGAA